MRCIDNLRIYGRSLLVAQSGVKDGYVSTAVSTNAQWEKFCEAMDMPELLADERFATNESRGKNYLSSLRDIIQAKLASMTRDEIEAKLRPLNIPSGPVIKVSPPYSCCM